MTVCRSVNGRYSGTSYPSIAGRNAAALVTIRPARQFPTVIGYILILETGTITNTASADNTT